MTSQGISLRNLINMTNGVVGKLKNYHLNYVEILII
jgi:hypothetical protein